MEGTARRESHSQGQRQPALTPTKAALLEKWLKGKGPSAARQAIPRGDGPGPLSFAQQRLWFLHELDPASPAYSMFMAHRLRGPLDEAALDRALVEIVRRHECLRTTFETGPDGAPRQVVRPPPASLLDARDVGSEAELRRALGEETRTPIDLALGPILRARLLRLPSEERFLLVTVHHVAFDEWSELVFQRELSALYTAFSQGRPSPLPELPIQYADFARWQRDRLQGAAMERALEHWRSRLAGVPPLDLPTDRPRPPGQSFSGRMLPFRLDKETSEALRALCRAEGVTPFMALLAAFQVFLHRHSSQDDFAVGSPIAGRDRPETEGLIGFFVNTLVLRADLSGEPTFRDLLGRVKETCLGAYASPDLPFERLVEDLHPERDPARTPLFQSFFAYQAAPSGRLSLPGVRVEPEWVFSPTSKFDLSLFVLDDPAGMRCWLEHRTDLWDAETGERMARRFRALVEGIVRDPSRRLGECPLLPDDELNEVVVLSNATESEFPREACVHRLVEKQARLTPDREAVACGDARLTYSELDKRATRLARRLRARGAGPDVLVALLVDRSVDMVAALLGVLKSGAAYVPLDPTYPRDRLAYMLEDSGAPILVTDAGLDLPPHGAEVVLLNDTEEKTPDVPPDGGAGPDDLAYVIYTSGSTGKPKGTEIPHRALANFLWDMRGRLRLGADDRWLSVTTPSFDIAALEIYLPLMVGATVEVAPREEVRDPRALLGSLRRASIMQATPATWRMLLDAGWSPGGARLRKALSGGETLPLALARGLMARADEVWNLYGPTETTIWSTAHRLGEGDNRVSIGHPIANTRAYVLDAGKRPVPVGVPGELYLGGAGLARGYHNRPDLTAERFVEWKGERLYRTGDLVRWLPDGTLEHMGRLDFQVKVRGYRVELGEVEAALMERVREAVVVPSKDGLVAYVVPREDETPPSLVGMPLRASGTPRHAKEDPLPDLARAIVQDWRPVFDAHAAEEPADPTFDTGVWSSSHTGKPFPREEMEEWVATTVERVLSFRPTRVLEIGCGTGLLMWRIAPHCAAYLGTDFSGATLARLERETTRRGVGNVRLLEREAIDFSGVDGTYDTVVLNSVAQYFPDAEYLARVIEQAASRVRGGVIFVGDVRSLPLQRAFHASVERALAGRDLPPEELERLVDKRVAAEAELLIHPAFFEGLRDRIPSIGRVRVVPRAGRHRNEMNGYRYDVILHVGAPPPPTEVGEWRDWPGLEPVRRRLLEKRPDSLGFLRVPNARVDDRPDAVEPDDLVALARECGYTVELSWAAGRPDGSLDAVLARGDGPLVADFPREARPRDLASEPLRTRVRRGLVPHLRARLAERLPEPMVPGTFVVLDALPLTPNGKVDRRALPPPESDRPDLPEAYVPPRTPEEEAIARVWAQLLSVDRVGARDNFFTLGGHSLLATQMVARLRDALGVEIPLRTVFASPTVEALAALKAAPARPPVLPLADRDGVPLSSGQERLWFLHQLDPASPAYNVAVALRIREPLREDALRRALDGLLARHEALRTTVGIEDCSPVQRVQPPGEVPLQVLDARDEAEARRLAEDAAHAPFDLARGPVFRATLVRIGVVAHDDAEKPRPAGLGGLGGDDHVLVLAAHHLVSDEWSERVLLRDLTALYAGEALPPQALQPGDVSEWQRRQDVGAQLSYWRERLADLRPAEVPTDKPRPPVQTFGGRSVRVSVPADGLRALARRSDATLFMVLVAACQTLLARHGGSDDLVLGSPVAGRGAPGAEDVVGFFVNTLVLRTDLSGDPTFRDLVLRVRNTCLGAYANQEAPFERVVRELGHPRDLGRTPLFQAALVLQGPQEPVGLGERFHLESRVAKFDFTFWAAEEADQLSIALEYNVDLFEEATALRMARHLEGLLRAAGTTPDLRLSELAPPDDEARAWSGQATEYPRERCVHELFEDGVRRWPGRVALVADGNEVTYAELDERADALAGRLGAAGVGPDVLVGVCLERSVDAVVALLAVLKAGGAYVPLDPAHPDDRLAFVLGDTGAPVVVTSSALRDRLALLHDRLLLVDVDEPAPDVARGDVRPDHLAYVMYTSGSTGRPKGVMVPHRAVVRLVAGQDYVRFGPDEVFLQYAPLAFDAATFEIWGALLSGARLAVAPPRALSVHELGDLLRAHGVTTLWLTAPLFHLLVDENLEGLGGVRQLVAGGDALSAAHVRRALRAFPGLRLVNGYGPTESTTFACCHVVLQEPGERVPIGRPIANTRAHVLDSRMRPVPVGAPGELYLGGDGLARGYLNLPELTASRFVQANGERLYRTGDRVRWLADGNLDFLGRLDDQVKVRGHRVEPGEVEAVLRERVKEAVVVPRSDGEGDLHLVAYVVGDATPDELRDHLRRRLPEPFVPSAFVTLDALPLTLNGKVDRRALPEPARDDAPGYEAPAGPVEEILAGIWARTLGLQRVGAHDDFFALGGDSLGATRVAARVRHALGVDLPLPAFFSARTLRSLGRVVRELTGGAPALPPIERAREGEPAPLSFGQERLWFLHQWRPAIPAYNVPGAFRLRGRLDVGALEAALDVVVRRHDVLRTVYPAPGGKPVQRVLPHEPLRLPVEEASGEDEARRLADEHAARPFDLAQGPVYRFRLLRVGEHDHVLLVAFHHVAFDGWSVGVLLREVGEIYAARLEGRPPRLPDLPVQYEDYARWQRSSQGEVAGAHLAAWRERLAGLLPFDLPTDHPRPPALSMRGGRAAFLVPPRLSRDLEALARREGATLFMCLLAAWNALLARHAGQDDVAVGSPVGGRRLAELHPLIGFFVNTLVLRTDLSGDPTFRELLARVRGACLDAYGDQDVPFERLVEELQPERDPGRAPLVQAFFALQEGLPDAFPGSGLRVERMECETGAAKFDLSCSLEPAGDGLRGELEYSTDLFEHDTSLRLSERYVALLEGIAADPDLPLSRIPVMTARERERVVHEWNATEGDFPRERSVHELFEAHAARTPDAVALESDVERVTYAELEERAARLARRLRALGAGPETLVGIHLPRSVEAFVAILAVLKAGAAYVPLDPSYPEARVHHMLTDSAAPLVVTRADLAKELPSTAARVVLVEEEPEAADAGEAPPGETGPDNLAYVIYTSGSTGRPKGVLVEHGGVLNLAAALAPLAGPGTRLLQSSSLSFDASVAELALTLLQGGTLVLGPRDATAGTALHRVLSERRINAVILTPSVLRTLRPEGLPDLRVVVSAGEACPAEVARAWSQGRRFFNGYGPTEATVAVTFGEFPPGASIPPPLGRPLPNVRAYVLDDHLEPVPVGVAGELYVGGAGVARGYLHRPELTAERFVPDPFHPGEGARLYRTGDLCRWLPTGELQFLGRRDEQVKVRGFRIELGEVESVLLEHPSVREAVVAAREDRLVAYVVGDGGPAELRGFLRSRLPDHMVPSAFVALEALPVSPNGKVDRRALPAPGTDPEVARAPYVEPRGPTERALARAWSELLGVPRVGAGDGFFELGGHSLLVPRLVARVRDELGVELPLGAVFEAPTLDALARRVDSARTAKAPSGIRRADRARYRLQGDDP